MVVNNSRQTEQLKFKCRQGSHLYLVCPLKGDYSHSGIVFLSSRLVRPFKNNGHGEFALSIWENKGLTTGNAWFFRSISVLTRYRWNNKRGSQCSRAAFLWPLTCLGFDLGLVQHHKRWSTFPVQIVIATKRWNRSDSVFPPRWSTLMVLNKAQSNPRLVRGKRNVALSMTEWMNEGVEAHRHTKPI